MKTWSFWSRISRSRLNFFDEWTRYSKEFNRILGAILSPGEAPTEVLISTPSNGDPVITSTRNELDNNGNYRFKWRMFSINITFPIDNDA